MKKVSLKNWKSKSILTEALEFEAIGQRAVAAALSNSFRKKVPLVFEFRELIYFLLPDGQVSLRAPWKKASKK